jgi:predicted nucleotidyltransferase
MLATLRLLRVVHVATEIPLDVILAAEGIEQAMLARARTIDVEGVDVPFVGVEDLVALKLLAGRRKDLEDVRSVLLAQGGRIDLALTRTVLSALQQGSEGRGDLLAKLDRVLSARSSGRRKKPRPK